jgi:hypothetical protein
MRRSRRHSSGKNVSATPSPAILQAADTTASTTDNVASLPKHQLTTLSNGTTAASKITAERAVESGKIDGIKNTAATRKSSVTDATAIASTSAASFNKGRAVHNNTSNNNDSTTSTAALKHNNRNQHQLNDDDNTSLGLSSDQSMTESESDD